MAGTELTLQAERLPPDVRAQLVDCRNTRVLLTGEGEANASGGARWLARGWLDVDAGLSGGEITALLSAETVPQNIRMLEEAKAVLARRPER